jgi:protein-tyrosine-phosphatase
MTPKRFIFVCSGNICRSPMAEGIARKRLAEAGIAAQAISMGTLGIFGQPASGHAVDVCADHGIDISDHRSQGVSYGLLDRADAVLVMERAHQEQLLQLRPDLTNVWLLSQFDGESDSPDVADPIGQDRAAYEACYERLERAVGGLVRAVQRGVV